MDQTVDPRANTRKIHYGDISHTLKQIITITPNINTQADIDEAVLNLENEIVSAVNQNTTHITPTTTQPIKLPRYLKQAINARNRARRLFQETLYPPHKHEHNRLGRHVKALLKEFHNSRWNRKVESLNPEDNSLWKISKALRTKNPPPTLFMPPQA